LNKKDLTKELLANCFKELVLTRPFEKITIKTITDRAGLIRPTFYKHFQDKYEVLEWIFQTEVLDPADELLKEGRIEDACLAFCEAIDENRPFYKKALKTTGPNSFPEILQRRIYDMILDFSAQIDFRIDRKLPYLTKQHIARFYARGISGVVEDWLSENSDISAVELYEGYRYLMVNSAVDLVLRQFPDPDD